MRVYAKFGDGNLAAVADLQVRLSIHQSMSTRLPVTLPFIPLISTQCRHLRRVYLVYSVLLQTRNPLSQLVVCALEAPGLETLPAFSAFPSTDDSLGSLSAGFPTVDSRRTCSFFSACSEMRVSSLTKDSPHHALRSR